LPYYHYSQSNKDTSKNTETVNIEAYADLIFREAINTPTETIKAGGNISDAMSVVRLCVYLQEKIIKAWGKLSDEDLNENSEYVQKYKLEEQRLSELVRKGELTEEAKKNMLAYFKLGLLLEIVYISKAQPVELEV
jgi:hypothetical protein